MFSELTTEGVIFVAFAWTIVIGLLTFCLFKIFSGEKNLEKAARKKVNPKSS